MESHQRMHKHAALRRDPAYASARPANLARDVKDYVERHQDEVLGKRVPSIFPEPTPAKSGGHSGNLKRASDSGSELGHGSNAGTSPGNDGVVGGSGGSSGKGNDVGTSNGTGSGGGNADTTTSSTTLSTTTRSKTEISSKSTSMSTTESSTSTTKSSSVKTSTSTSSKPTSVLSSSSTLPLATFTQPKILTSTVSTVGTPSSTLAANSASSKSNSPGAGPIIGIVAAALVGVAILSALIGFIWKKCVRRDDPYEANPFDKDDFRRHSAMLPDTFDNDDGAPSMSEHHNFSPNMYEGAGMAGMGIIAAGAGVAAASDRMAHNEIGAPRPPTMFQRHINGPAAQFDSNAAYSQAPNVPPVPSMGAYGPAYPQLPPMAFGGAAEAFVAGGVPPMANVANPYAHLDRGMHDASSGLGRSGSNVSGSGGSGGYGSAQEDYMDTAGRPGTSESRSGTPDLPNVQQTYAALDQHNRFPKFNSPPSEPVRNPFGDGGNDSHNAAQQHDSMDSTNMLQHYYTGSKGSASGAGADAGRNASPMTMMQNHNAATAVSSFPANLQSQPSLSVRNFMPSQAASNTRPISTVSTQADPDDAYGGVW